MIDTTATDLLTDAQLRVLTAARAISGPDRRRLVSVEAIVRRISVGHAWVREAWVRERIGELKRIGVYDVPEVERKVRVETPEHVPESASVSVAACHARPAQPMATRKLLAESARKLEVRRRELRAKARQAERERKDSRRESP